MESALIIQQKIENALKKHSDLVDQLGVVNSIITRKRDDCELRVNTLIRSFGETLTEKLNSGFQYKQIYVAQLMMAVHGLRNELEETIGKLSNIMLSADIPDLHLMQSSLIENLDAKMAELDAFHNFSVGQSQVLDFITSETLNPHTLGYIQTSLVSPQDMHYKVIVKSSVENVYPGDTISIKVTSNMSFYDPLMWQSLNCIVESPISQKSATGKEFKNNTYEYTYKVEVVGKHTIEISLFGEHISESPSCFEVYEKPASQKTGSLLNAIRSPKPSMNNRSAGATFSPNYSEFSSVSANQTFSKSSGSKSETPASGLTLNSPDVLTTSASFSHVDYPYLSSSMSSSRTENPSRTSGQSFSSQFTNSSHQSPDFNFLPKEDHRISNNSTSDCGYLGPTSSSSTSSQGDNNFNNKTFHKVKASNLHSFLDGTLSNNTNDLPHLINTKENSPSPCVPNNLSSSPKKVTNSQQSTDTNFLSRTDNLNITFSKEATEDAGGYGDIALGSHNVCKPSGDWYDNISDSFKGRSPVKSDISSVNSSGGRGRGAHTRSFKTSCKTELRKSVENLSLKADQSDVPEKWEDLDPSPNTSSITTVSDAFIKQEEMVARSPSPKTEPKRCSPTADTQSNVLPLRADHPENVLSSVEMYMPNEMPLFSNTSSDDSQPKVFWSDVERWKISGHKVKANFLWKSNTDFRFPIGVAPTPDDNIVVCDTGHHRVVILNNQGQTVMSFGKEGYGNGEFHRPSAVVILDDHRIAIKDDHKIQFFSPSGDYMSSCRNVSFKRPFGLAKDGEGRLVTLDVGLPASLNFFSQEGELLARVPYEPLCQPNPNSKCRFMDAHENQVVVVDLGLACIYVSDFDGNLVHYFGAPGRREGQFRDPAGITIDINHNFFIADSKNSRVQVFNSKYQFLTFVDFGDHPIHRPSDICLTRTGKLLVLNYTDHVLSAYDLQC